MNVIHNIDNITLTSGEIAELFNAYIFNSASSRELSYFVKKTQDPDITTVLELSLNMSNNTVNRIADIFKSINHPIPKGFSEEDVNVNAERLFSDHFMLTFVRFMARFQLANYSESRASCTRSDVIKFFNESILSTLNLLDMSDEILLKKGIYIKSPYIPIPESIDFVKKQSFLNGFFGEKRPLNAAEINRLYLSFQRNSLGKAFLMGLCQTTRNKEIKDYLIRGKDLSQDHMDIIGTLLKNEDLPVPMTLGSEVTASTDPVFSDRLTMFHVAGLAGLGLDVTGTSLARVMRRDIALALARIMSEISLYAEDGMNIMIENEWFERVPQAADREELIDV